MNTKSKKPIRSPFDCQCSSSKEIAIDGVSGEVLTNISLRLKRDSPFNRTVMVTHANGSSGYLPDDAAYEQVS